MKIGIIGAMEVEVNTLKQKMTSMEKEEYARMEFCHGFLGSTEAVVVRSGVGKVNAALCVQILIDCFHVDHIINTGVAGSLNNELNIEDILVSKDACYHDVDATVFGYAPGEIPQLGIRFFPADETLRKAAVEAVAKAAPDVKAIEGRVVSGDQFVRDPETKKRLREVFDGDCAEMEGTAIAQASWLNHVPFVIIRAISDKADGSDIMAYDVFEKKAAENCASIVFEMVRSLGEKA